MNQPKTPLRSESLLDILGIVVLFAFCAAGLNLLRDPGVGWHLKTGWWIAQHQQVPMQDLFLWTSEGRNWICNQWLGDLIFWWVYSIGGWPTLQVFSFLVCLVPFVWFAAPRLRPFGVSAPAACIGLLLCMGLGLVQWYVRPVIFSFLLFGLLYKLIAAEGLKRGNLSALFLITPAVLVLWANLHPAFPLGLLLIGFAALSSLFGERQRVKRALQYSTLLALSAAATLLNPYGTNLHKEILGLVGSDYFMNLNAEWQSPNFHNPLFLPFLASIALIFIAPRRQELPVFEKLSLGAFTVLGLISARYVPFLGIVALVPVATALQAFLSKVSTVSSYPALEAFTTPAGRGNLKVGAATLLAGVGLLIFTQQTGSIPGWSKAALSIEEKISAEAVTILKGAPAGSKIFHTPNFGGFFTWSFWPDLRPFIDDRNELNGNQIYEDYFEIAKLRPKWREVLQRYQFQYLVLEKDSPIHTAILDTANWKQIYSGESISIFTLMTP